MCARVAGSVIPEAVILKQICPGPVVLRAMVNVATPLPAGAPGFGTSLIPVKPAIRTQPPIALNGPTAILPVLGTVAAWVALGVDAWVTARVTTGVAACVPTWVTA